MKVSELIELLREVDPDSLIFLSSDQEGNSFNPLEEHSFAFYYPEGEPDDLVFIEDEEDSPELMEKVLVLWPGY